MASPSIEQIVAQIRTALFGKDVRENIALGIEKCYSEVPSDAVKYTSQSLTDAQKTQARTNIGAAKTEDAQNVVKYTSQSLTDAQKTQARTNIGAVKASVQQISGTTSDYKVILV